MGSPKEIELETREESYDSTTWGIAMMTDSFPTSIWTEGDVDLASDKPTSIRLVRDPDDAFLSRDRHHGKRDSLGGT